VLCLAADARSVFINTTHPQAGSWDSKIGAEPYAPVLKSAKPVTDGVPTTDRGFENNQILTDF